MSESGNVVPIPEGVPIFPPSQGGMENARPCLPGALEGTALPAAAPRAALQRVFSFPVMLGAVLVGATATISRTFFVDPDVWWHIKQGAFILATHQVPRADIYSQTLGGRPWIAYEWLGDVVLAITERLGGMTGLETLLILLGSAILIALYALSTVRSGNSKAAFAATAATFVLASVSFNLRPQMLGYLFLILTLIALERFRQGHRRGLWTLPILMLLWVNAHGSWVVGLGIITVYLVSGLVEFQFGDIEARRWSNSDRLQLIVVLALCASATLVTPYGTTLAKYPFEVAFSRPLGVANVVEWRPMPFNLLAGKIFLVMLLGSIVLQIAYHFAWRLEEIVLFLFAAAVASLHIRFLLIFVPLFIMRLAVVLARWIPKYDQDKERPYLNVLFMAIILALTLRYFPSRDELLRNVGESYPLAAVEYLNRHSVPGPMYNAYGFGGFLVWSRGPAHKVFIDGRSELYEREGVLADFLEIMNVRPDALSLLQKYGIQSCLLEHDEPLATFLAALPDWRKVYEDHTSILFVRRSSSSDFNPQSSDAASSSVFRPEERP